MTDTKDYVSKLREIVRTDPRYDIESYFFVQNALSFCVSKLEKKRHITGRELLDSIRQYTIQEYGPLGREVLEHWGVYRCEDFGEIVFNMVEDGLLRKSETDSKKDFENNFDFADAFNEDVY
ncbi:MAG: hypothetical protein RAO92_06915 [Candidatus Euphemobacter frigidus]|nr:hypothetical protein [Candidatus Euphemobacter frigidus]MDP8276117.1 hypothetical protein [Candidatus Euphemobacter frigidus]